MKKTGPFARGGDVCSNDQEQLAELIFIINEAAGAAGEAGEAGEAAAAPAAPNFKPLIDLLNRYKDSGKTPGLVEHIKTTIKNEILKDNVKALISPVLISLFGGLPTTDQNRADHKTVSDCILDALMKDFSLLDYVKLVGKMYLKSYYDDNIFRVGVATAFTGSGIYIAWNSGIGAIAGLSKDGCIYLMSVLSSLLELVNNQEELTRVLNTISIPREYTVQITIFIQQLRNNISNRSNIIFMITAGMVALMERLHPEFRPLDGMRAEAAAAAAAGGVPAAAAPVAPAAAGAGTVPAAVNDDLLNQLLEPLREGRDIAIGIFHKYLTGILNLLHGIAFRRVGVVVPPEDKYAQRLSGYICRHIVDYITLIENQAELAGTPRSYLNAKFTIDALLNTPQLLNMTVSESKTHILRLASTIRRTVIECLRNDHVSLERICPMFRSAMIEENIKLLEMDSQLFMLKEFIPSRISDSQLCNPSQTPTSERDATLDIDIKKRIEQGQNFFLENEENTLQQQEEKALLAKADSLFWNAPGLAFHQIMRLAETATVCGFVSFSKNLFEQGKAQFAKGREPSSAPNPKLPSSVSINPVSAQYLPMLRKFDEVIRAELNNESVLGTGITKDMKTRIYERLQESLIPGRKLSVEELNVTLSKMYDAFKFDESQRMGRPGGGYAEPAFLNKMAILFINPAATSGVAVEVVDSSPSLVRTLTGSNPPSLASEATAPVRRSFWKFMETAANVICKKLQPSSEGSLKRSREDVENVENVEKEEEEVKSLLEVGLPLDAILDGIEKGNAEQCEGGGAVVVQNSADDMTHDTAGGSSRRRRKSRKNAKKTTRRNKKIVRKSSKNTKQRRSSRRSSRKSRK